jgi:hypothetical protein
MAAKADRVKQTRSGKPRAAIKPVLSPKGVSKDAGAQGLAGRGGRGSPFRHLKQA